ncbi:MAG: hypothetical protein QM729_21385 [Solirubrobacterales bacterium]
MSDELLNFDPTELLTASTRHVGREIAAQKTLMDRYPGHIVTATDKGSFNGVRQLLFTPDGIVGESLDPEAQARLLLTEKTVLDNMAKLDLQTAPTAVDYLNQYFADRGNLLLLDTQPIRLPVTYSASSDEQSGDLADMGPADTLGILAKVTIFLDADDLEELEQVQRMVNEKMREFREQRAKDEADIAEEQAKDGKFAEIGRKVVDHNLFGKLKEQAKEIKKLQLEVLSLLGQSETADGKEN